MSEDERLAKIKDLLDSTVAEFEAVFKSAGTFDQSRVGNGWTPAKIPIQNYAIEPMTLSEATKIAESRKARLFGPLGLMRFRSSKIVSVTPPALVYYPFWRAKGYHECFYFRGKTYLKAVPDDVIAVQVDGRIRTLASGAKTKPTLLHRATTATKRVLLAQTEPRHLTVDNATELAYQHREGSVLLNWEGREDLSMEYLLEKKTPIRRLAKRESLKSDAAEVKLTSLSFTAEDAVQVLHSKVVKPPAVFSRILTNRFEVTELHLLELPVYLFKFRYLGREKELRVHGVTGESLR